MTTPDAQPTSGSVERLETTAPAVYQGNKEVAVPQVELTDALRKYDLIGVTDDGVIVMSDRGETPQYGEIGTTSPSPFTGWLRQEYNNDLRDKRGLQKYDEMRRSDPDVRGSLRMLKTPVLTGRWFIEPGGESARDKNAAKFIWWNLTEGMTSSWPQLLMEMLLMLDYGYYAFEKVFSDIGENPEQPDKVTWKKLAPRHPLDVQDWVWDSKGGPAGIEIYDPGTFTVKTIPIGKLAVFTFDKEGGDMTGISILRSAYKPWHYKSNLEKIDAIQKERHGIGIPIIKLPMNFNEADKRLAEELGRNLRTNERAHVVLPPGWDLLFAKLEGQPVNAMESIQYYKREIWQNILAPFMAMESGTGSGKDDDKILFLKSSRFIADIVCDIINQYCIKQLIDYNYVRVKYPKLRVRRIGEQADQRTVSFGLRNLVGAGIVRPDDRLEETIREEFDLPKVDPETIRMPPTPQAPGSGVGGGGSDRDAPGAPKPPGARVGPPRQQPLPPSGPGRSNAGGDRSGG